LTPASPLRAALARPKSWRAFALRSALTLGALASLVAIASPSALLDALGRAPLGVWLGTAGGLAAGHALAAMKWRRLLAAVDAHCTPLQALRAHGAGLFANLLLPSLVGGDIVRAAALARGDRTAAVATASIADRLIDTLALALLAALGAIIVRPLGTWHWLAIAAVASGVLAGSAIAVGILRASPVNRLSPRLAGLATRLRDAALRLAAAPGSAAVALGLSLTVQLAFVWLNARLGSALGIQASFAVWLLCWPLAKIVALLPISLGGLGVREAALAGLLGGFGVSTALAVGQSLLWQVALIAVGSLGGALALVTVTDERSATGPGDGDTAN